MKMKWWWLDRKYAFGFVKDLIHFKWKPKGEIPKTYIRTVGRTSGKVHTLASDKTFPNKQLALKEANKLARKNPTKTFQALLMTHAYCVGSKYKGVFSGKENWSHAILPVWCVYSVNRGR